MGQGKSTLTHLNKSNSGDQNDSLLVSNPLYDDRFAVIPKNHRQSRDHSSEIIEAVMNNNYEFLLTKRDSLSSDGTNEHDICTIKEEVAQYRDKVNEWTVFHFAAYFKSDSIVEWLIEFLTDIPDIECVNGRSKGYGFTALHLAVQDDDDNDQLVSALMRHPRIDVNVRDADGRTPLHHVCQRGLCKTVVTLQNVDFCCHNIGGYSPLHLAASNHHSALFSALSECESFKERYTGSPEFLGVRDQEGNTLLHLAVDIADSYLVTWCLEMGFQVQTCNKHQMNCLHIAAMRGNYDIAARILGKAENATIVNSLNSDRSTPLYVAAMYGNVKIIKLLLHNGARTDCMNSMHLTPLLAAIRYTQPEAVRILLRRGADWTAKDRLRSYNAILWAVEIQNLEILNMLLAYVLEKQGTLQSVWKEADSEENTAHHLAAKARNLDLLKKLVQYNTHCLTEKNGDGYTPFHIAVREGRLAIMNFIISKGANAAYTLDGHGSSGLHLAAEFGHSTIVDRLLRVRSSDVSISTRNNSGWTPIHLAAKNGHTTTLELLLQHSQPETYEILDFHHHTALYLACSEGQPKCTELLLKNNAMVTYCYYHEGNNRPMSCLNAAIDAGHITVVTTVLESKQWRQALQFCSHADSKSPETPLCKLIKKMPGAAKVAFEQCWMRVKAADKSGMIQNEIHYNYDYVEDFQDLFQDHGPRIQEEDHESQETSEGRFAHQERNVLRRMNTMQHAAVCRGSTVSSQSEAYVPQHAPTAFARPSGEPWGPKKYYYQNHPLYLMVLHKRQELLKHPVVASFIHHKWNLFGRWVYYPNIAFYTLLMLLLTVYIYLRFDYSKVLINTYEKQLNASLSLSDCSRNITLDSISQMVDDDVVNRLQQDRNRLIICSVFIIFNCIARIIMEIFQIIHHYRDYFLHVINYMEGILYVATIVFVSNFQLHCLPSWQWQLGALCIFLSWINFILFLSEQPVVGIYVVMFQDIIKTFLHMAPMAVLLVLAFGQPFFMLLSVVETTTPPQQFLTFPYSLLKTLAMTTGELETDRIFFSSPSVVTYPAVTYILWIIFLVIMPILLQNLLVGLAVDDIKSVQEKAALKKEALQIGFILDVLSRTPKCLIKKINKRKYKQTWGKEPLEKLWKWLNGSYWKPDLKLDYTKEYSVALKMDNMLELVSTMDKRIQSQLNEQNAKLEKMMHHCLHEQERHIPPVRKEHFYSSSETII